MFASQTRQYRLMKQVTTAIKAGNKVIILPENAGGIWWPATRVLWAPVIQGAQRQHVTLIIGAELWHGQDQEGFFK